MLVAEGVADDEIAVHLLAVEPAVHSSGEKRPQKGQSTDSFLGIINGAG